MQSWWGKARTQRVTVSFRCGNLPRLKQAQSWNEKYLTFSVSWHLPCPVWALGFLSAFMVGCLTVAVCTTVFTALYSSRAKQNTFQGSKWCMILLSNGKIMLFVYQLHICWFVWRDMIHFAAVNREELMNFILLLCKIRKNVYIAHWGG